MTLITFKTDRTCAICGELIPAGDMTHTSTALNKKRCPETVQYHVNCYCMWKIAEAEERIKELEEEMIRYGEDNV